MRPGFVMSQSGKRWERAAGKSSMEIDRERSVRRPRPVSGCCSPSGESRDSDVRRRSPPAALRTQARLPGSAVLELLAFTASLLFGIVPWMLQRRLQFGSPLQEHNRTTAGGRAERRVQAWLVTAEIAFSMVLLVNAALLLASFRQVLHADPGFDTNNLLTVNIGLPWKKFQKQDQRYQYFERLLDEVRKIPGVESASMTNAVPFRGEAELRSLRLAGQRQEAIPHAELRMVDPDYLRTMHIPLIRGRWFRTDEREHVTVISENMARRYWPKDDPLGQQFFENETKLTIVGVVGEVRNATLEREPTLQFYIPAAANVYAGMWFVIRTKVPPENLISDIRRSLSAGRSGAAAGAYSNHAGDSRRNYPIAAIRDLAIRGLRWHSALLIGPGRVWSTVSLSDAADARVRDSHGARGNGRERVAVGTAGGIAIARGRCNSRRGAGDPLGPLTADLIVRRQCYRSPCICHHYSRAGCGGFRRVLDSGAPSGGADPAAVLREE